MRDASRSRVFLLLLVVLVPLPGCLLYFGLWVGDSGHLVLLQGDMLDAVTLEPATDAVFGVRAFRGGRVVQESSPMLRSGEARFPPPDADGHFSVEAAFEFGPFDTTKSFPVPDQIILIVVRGACTEEIELTITDRSVVRSAEVDPAQRTEILSLTEPVLVSPCVP